ncbi:MAG: hypothetical protein AAGI66_03605 [Cyanobacteria bacterium P01_H01_bin.74]
MPYLFALLKKLFRAILDLESLNTGKAVAQLSFLWQNMTDSDQGQAISKTEIIAQKTDQSLDMLFQGSAGLIEPAMHNHFLCENTTLQSQATTAKEKTADLSLKKSDRKTPSIVSKRIHSDRDFDIEHWFSKQEQYRRQLLTVYQHKTLQYKMNQINQSNAPPVKADSAPAKMQSLLTRIEKNIDLIESITKTQSQTAPPLLKKPFSDPGLPLAFNNSIETKPETPISKVKKVERQNKKYPGSQFDQNIQNKAKGWVAQYSQKTSVNNTNSIAQEKMAILPPEPETNKTSIGNSEHHNTTGFEGSEETSLYEIQHHHVITINRYNNATESTVRTMNKSNETLILRSRQSEHKQNDDETYMYRNNQILFNSINFLTQEYFKP